MNVVKGEHSSNGNTHNGHVRRSDIEDKLRELRGEVESVSRAAKPVGLGIVAVVGFAAVGIAYLMGTRKAKKRNTVVEIRRI